jgi:ATP-dependent DNA helicase RecG
MKLIENETLELKKSTSLLKSAIKSLVAILNKHRKGQLYFGIRDNGDVIGQDVGEKTIREISQEISNHIEPKIYPEVNEIDIKGKKCILVEFSGNETPYFAYGRAYMRVGDEDRQLSARELEEMIIMKNQDKLK